MRGCSRSRSEAGVNRSERRAQAYLAERSHSWWRLAARPVRPAQPQKQQAGVAVHHTQGIDVRDHCAYPSHTHTHTHQNRRRTPAQKRVYSAALQSWQVWKTCRGDAQAGQEAEADRILLHSALLKDEAKTSDCSVITGWMWAVPHNLQDTPVADILHRAWLGVSRWWAEEAGKLIWLELHPKLRRPVC